MACICGPGKIRSKHLRGVKRDSRELRIVCDGRTSLHWLDYFTLREWQDVRLGKGQEDQEERQRLMCHFWSLGFYLTVDVGSLRDLQRHEAAWPGLHF